MIDPTRLYTALLNTGLQQKDNPLYQVIRQLIDQLANVTRTINSGTTGGGSVGATGATGPQGQIGFAIDGIDGDDTIMVMPGPQGNPGPTGLTGPVGLTGPIGLAEDGVDGEDGVGIPGRAIQVYEQYSEPTGAYTGDFWIIPV